MDDLFPITLLEQLQCVKREIEMRDRVYPRWVAAGKMTQDKADKETATMRAVAKTVQAAMEAPGGTPKCSEFSFTDDRAPLTPPRGRH